MEKTAIIRKCPTAKDSIRILTDMLNLVYELEDCCVICDEDAIDAFELYTNVVEGVLLNSTLLLSVEEEFKGNPISYHVFILSSEQEAFILSRQLEGFSKCRIITYDEFKGIAGYDWNNPKRYTTLAEKPCFEMKQI